VVTGYAADGLAAKQGTWHFVDNRQVVGLLQRQGGRVTPAYVTHFKHDHVGFYANNWCGKLGW
jgi:hypothetical protein